MISTRARCGWFDLSQRKQQKNTARQAMDMPTQNKQTYAVYETYITERRTIAGAEKVVMVECALLLLKN
jgi:hypothetical protein